MRRLFLMWAATTLVLLASAAWGAEKGKKPSVSFRITPRAVVTPREVLIVVEIKHPGPELFCPEVRIETLDQSFVEGWESDCPPWEEWRKENPQESIRLSWRSPAKVVPGTSFAVRVTQGKKSWTETLTLLGPGR